MPMREDPEHILPKPAVRQNAHDGNQRQNTDHGKRGLSTQKNVAEPFSCSASTEDAEYTISRPKHTKVNKQAMNIKRGRMIRAGTPAI